VSARSERPVGRRKWLVVVAVVVILVVWLLILADRAASAYRQDKRGLALLEQVKADLGPGDLTSSGSIVLLDQAHADFASAKSDLSSPLFAPVTIVPVVGRQLQSARALSAGAATVAATGSSFLAGVHNVLNQPHSAGLDRVTSLRSLARLSAASLSSLNRIDTGPSNALISPLAAKRNEFVGQLDSAKQRLAKAAAVSGVVANILEGPQTYLLLAANNAEMRAGSGAFLNVGVATTTNGTLQLGNLGDSGDRPLAEGQVTITGDLQRNWGWLHPSLDYRNLGLTPQFNVTAAVAAQMWTTQTGQPIDGVLAFDVAGLRQLLEATGPVQVGALTVTADSVEQYLLHDQYVGLNGASVTAAARDEQLGALAKAVLQQLQSQSTDLKSLASAVSGAVAGRHLMVWSQNSAAQAAWVTSGVSGTLTPQSLDLSLINLGGNKLDQYVSIRNQVITKASGSSTTVTMTSTLTNATPAGQPEYIAGPFPGNPAPYGSYIGLVAANLPARATHISMTGPEPLAVNGAEGPTWLRVVPATLNPGTTISVVTRFTLPGTYGSMTIVPSARLPAEQWSFNGRTFDDSATTTVSW